MPAAFRSLSGFPDSDWLQSPHFKALLDAIPIALFIKDQASRFLMMNRACEEQWGMSFDDLSGTDASQFFPAEQMAFFLAKDREVFDGRRLIDFEESFWNAKLQANRLGHTYKQPIYDADGQPRYLVCVTLDITDRKQAEAVLRASEEKLRGLFELSPLGIALTDMSGGYVEFNEAFRKICGYPAEELKTLDYWTLTPPEFAPQEQQQLDSLAATGHYGPYEKVYRQKDGTLVPIRLNGMLVKDSAGQDHIWSIVENVSERNQITRQLHDSEQRYRALYHSSRDCIMVLEAPDWRFSAGNPATLALFCARNEAEFITQSPAQLSPEYQPDGRLSAEKAGEMIATALREGAHAFEWTHRRLNGESFPASVLLTRFECDGKVMLQATVRDISERKRAEQELRVAASVFQSQEAMLVTDQNRNILRVNQAFTRITGYDEAEVIGKNPRMFQSGRQSAVFYQEMWAAIEREGSWQGEIWDQRKSGQHYPKWMTISSVKGESGEISHYVASFTDITERKNAEEAISRLAYYDALTGLPNRRLLMDRVHHVLALNNRSGRHGALLFIDLDQFKNINDTLGHDAGDALLQEMAGRIVRQLRQEDTVARLGGDEFVVLLDDLALDTTESATIARELADKLLRVLSAPCVLQGKEFNISASIGIALLDTEHQGNAQDLLKRADMAMYEAKKAGRNAARFFDPAIQQAIEHKLLLERELRIALRENHLVLYFQRRVKGLGEVTGAEVLIRWQHPERGLVPPMEFIPVAEESELIVAIGQWVLENACRQLKEWETQPQLRQLMLSVNVSARQFKDDDFVRHTRDILARTGVNPALLELEITEGMLLGDVDGIIHKMRALQELGVTFSLDDFGTGYSSLSYLKTLPLNQLKIDRSFVRDLGVDKNDEAIAHTIIQMGQTLGLEVIAEGVENDQQRAILANRGCHNYQGYFFGKPVPLDVFVRSLAE